MLGGSGLLMLGVFCYVLGFGYEFRLLLVFDWCFGWARRFGLLGVLGLSIVVFPI